MGSEATGWCRLFETLGGVGQSEGGSEYNCCCFWWWCGGFDLNRVGEASVPLGELAWGTGGRESDRYTVFDLGAHCGAVRSERERDVCWERVAEKAGAPAVVLHVCGSLWNF